jgi:ribosomal protein L11
MQDLNAIDLKGAINMVKGSAVSMGMEVINWYEKN